jgi:hypothetical protein
VRRAALRDKSEKAIVAALRAVGAYVLLLSGKGVPDLLVYYKGIWTPLEVKTPRLERANRSHDAFTRAQKQVMDVAPYSVVESVAEALREIGAER